MTDLTKKTTSVQTPQQSRMWKEIKELLIILVVLLTVRTFLFQPFIIPSGSMYPSLMIGDGLIVSKYSYGLSRYSFPLAFHFFDGRWGDKRPQLGEVAVFNNVKDRVKPWTLFGVSLDLTPKDQGPDYIKRVVGLPGDKIQVKAGVLHINGEPVKLKRIEDYTLHDFDDQGYFTGQTRFVPQYIETLPNGVEHRILKDYPFGEGPLDNTQEFTVPAGHYFMMGDNRDHSKDSRVPEAVGFIPELQLVGRAEVIFFSSEAKWYQIIEWVTGLRFGRFFTRIR